MVIGEPVAVFALANWIFAKRHPAVRVTGEPGLISAPGQLRSDQGDDHVIACQTLGTTS